MDAADQSAREKKGYGDGLTQALTLVVGPGALRRSSAPSSTACSARAPLFLLVLGLVRRARHLRHRVLRVPGPDRAPRRGEAVGTTHAVNPSTRTSPTRARSPAISCGASCIVAPAVLLVAGRLPRRRRRWSAPPSASCSWRSTSSPRPRSITWAAQRSPGAVMGVVLGGYIVRIGDPVRHRARARAASRGSTCRVLVAHRRGRPSRSAHVGDPPREPHLGLPRPQAGRATSRKGQQ